MPDSKIDAAAEKAFADAAERKLADEVSKPALAAVLATEAAADAAPVAAKPIAKAKGKLARKAGALKPIAKASPAKPVPAKRVPAKKVAGNAAKPQAAKAGLPVAVSPVKTIKPTTTISQLKEKIMATANTTTADFTSKLQDGVAEMQTRAKAAYEKGAELTADVTAFHKGNFDALVESGKVLAAGMQDLGRAAVEDARSAADTMTADIKAIAAVKSPTELFQLQGEIARRNLDALVARTSKNAEMMMKLANDVFAPLSSRASVAMERLTKAA
jgi:phasin family protein